MQSDSITAQLQRTLTNMESTILEQSRKMSDLEQKLNIAMVIIGHQQNITTAMNQTIMNYQGVINNLENRQKEQNLTITDQRRRIAELLLLSVEQNKTITDQKSKLKVIEILFKATNITISNLQGTLADLIYQNMEQNTTIGVQQQIIEKCLSVSLEQNQTLQNNQQMLNTLQDKVHSLNQTQLGYYRNTSAVEGKIDLTLVEYGTLIDILNNQTQFHNECIAELKRQFHDMSLTVLHTERKTTLLNRTLQGMSKF